MCRLTVGSSEIAPLRSLCVMDLIELVKLCEIAHIIGISSKVSSVSTPARSRLISLPDIDGQPQRSINPLWGYT